MTTFDRLKKLLVDQLGISEDDITLDADIENDLGADSLDRVEIVMEVEVAWNLDITDAEAEKVKTVRDAVAMIDNAQSATVG